jgi:hypothetical protein
VFQSVEARARISALVPQGLSCCIELLGEQMVLLELAAGRHRKVRDDVAARWLEHFGKEAESKGLGREARQNTCASF